MLSLIVINGRQRGEVFHFEGEHPASIGREPGSAQLNDARVSREHCEVRFADGRWWIADLGSTNGTWVNDEAVRTPTELREGDQLRIGRFRLVVGQADAEPDANAAPDAPETEASLSAITRDAGDAEDAANAGGALADAVDSVEPAESAEADKASTPSAEAPAVSEPEAEAKAEAIVDAEHESSLEPEPDVASDAAADASSVSEDESDGERAADVAVDGDAAPALDSDADNNIDHDLDDELAAILSGPDEEGDAQAEVETTGTAAVDADDTMVPSSDEPAGITASADSGDSIASAITFDPEAIDEVAAPPADPTPTVDFELSPASAPDVPPDTAPDMSTDSLDEAAPADSGVPVSRSEEEEEVSEPDTVENRKDIAEDVIEEPAAASSEDSEQPADEVKAEEWGEADAPSSGVERSAEEADESALQVAAWDDDPAPSTADLSEPEAAGIEPFASESEPESSEPLGPSDSSESEGSESDAEDDEPVEFQWLEAIAEDEDEDDSDELDEVDEPAGESEMPVPEEGDEADVESPPVSHVVDADIEEGEPDAGAPAESEDSQTEPESDGVNWALLAAFAEQAQVAARPAPEDKTPATPITPDAPLAKAEANNGDDDGDEPTAPGFDGDGLSASPALDDGMDAASSDEHVALHESPAEAEEEGLGHGAASLEEREEITAELDVERDHDEDQHAIVSNDIDDEDDDDGDLAATGAASDASPFTDGEDDTTDWHGERDPFDDPADSHMDAATVMDIDHDADWAEAHGVPRVEAGAWPARRQGRRLLMVVAVVLLIAGLIVGWIVLQRPEWVAILIGKQHPVPTLNELEQTMAAALPRIHVDFSV